MYASRPRVGRSAQHRSIALQCGSGSLIERIASRGIQIAFILGQMDERWARERAIELFSLATRYPYVSNSRWLMDTAGYEINRSISELPADFVRSHQARGR